MVLFDRPSDLPAFQLALAFQLSLIIRMKTSLAPGNKANMDAVTYDAVIYLNESYIAQLSAFSQLNFTLFDQHLVQNQEEQFFDLNTAAGFVVISNSELPENQVNLPRTSTSVKQITKRPENQTNQAKQMKTTSPAKKPSNESNFQSIPAIISEPASPVFNTTSQRPVHTLTPVNISGNKLKSGELADDEDPNPRPAWVESTLKLLADTNRLIRGDFETSSRSESYIESETTSASIDLRDYYWSDELDTISYF